MRKDVVEILFSSLVNQQIVINYENSSTFLVQQRNVQSTLDVEELQKNLLYREKLDKIKYFLVTRKKLLFLSSKFAAKFPLYRESTLLHITYYIKCNGLVNVIRIYEPQINGPLSK